MSKLTTILDRLHPNWEYYFCKTVSTTRYSTLNESIPVLSSTRVGSLSEYIDIWEEKWDDTMYGGDTITIKVYRNKSGEYVGANEPDGVTKFILENNINPECIPGWSVCSIGYSETSQKYYGWSHRAGVGFGIGDKIFEENYGDDNTLFTQHGAVTIESRDQARQSATNFAKYVS